MGNLTSSYITLNSFIRVYNLRTSSIKSELSGWQKKDLLSSIWPLSTFDISSTLNGGMFAIPKDLKSELVPILPVKLKSKLHGWATKDLLNKIKGIHYPGDLKSLLNSIQPKDLKSQIVGYLGLETTVDLRSTISSFYTKSLSSIVLSVVPNDLRSTITSVGGSIDLESRIIPKVIYVSSVFKVSLLESLDLSSIVNCFCMKSDYSELGSYVYPFHKKDLVSYIISWNTSGTSDTIKDLVSSINTSVSYAKNSLDITFTPTKDIKHSELLVKFGASGWSKAVNDLEVFLTLKSHLNLKSSIVGELTHYDLVSRLIVSVPYNFTMLPEWINPKVREVFIDINKLETQAVRFVDMMFEAVGSEAMQYFYIAGENKVYKMSKDRKWSLWFTGYNRSPKDLVEKYNIRRKVLFDLTNYTTVDEAVRDLMTRAAEYSKINLTSAIVGTLPIHKDLVSKLSVKHYNKWCKHLGALLKPSYQGTRSLKQSIIAGWPKDSYSQSASIVGKAYEAPNADAADFNFENPGYTPDDPTAVDILWGTKQAEEFWK